MQVNRAMRDTVNGSSKIQRAIGLLPDWEADLTPTFWQDCDDETEDTFHGISYFDYDKRYCRTYDSRFDYIQKGLVPDPRTLTTADFILSTSLSSSTSPQELGSCCKTLSPCQPPIQKMEVRYNCGLCDHGPMPTDVGRVFPANGSFITLGDLHRVDLKIRTEHRERCRHPESEPGFRIEFVGGALLRDGDPIRLARQNVEVARDLYQFFWWDQAPQPSGPLPPFDEWIGYDEERYWQWLGAL